MKTRNTHSEEGKCVHWACTLQDKTMHWDCAPREKKAHQKQGKMTNCAPRVKEKCVLRKAHWNSGKRTRTCAREDIRIVH